MTMPTKGMRFAPIIRVSTEKQAKKGESLRTQMAQIKQYVQNLGGTIPDHCWRYVRQEHATPNHERTLLDQLLTDSGKGLFDAVIVCDPDRWSRDNLKSKLGLEILKKKKIQFYVGTTEYNLSDPDDKFKLGLYAEIGEMHAGKQSKKSLENRIERAKRGIPTTGKLPYGRTFSDDQGIDPATGMNRGWGINDDKRGIILDTAKRYFRGEPIPNIAASYGMNAANLWKVLTQRSGDTWEQKFVSPDLNIDETVITRVPRLLEEDVIAKILRRAEENKTYHGIPKHPYLLSKKVFCTCGCGYHLVGEANRHGTRHYRYKNKNQRRCRLGHWPPADPLEKSVIIHLVQLFGDPERLGEVIARNTPDPSKRGALEKEQAAQSRKLNEIDTGRKNLVREVIAGHLSGVAVKDAQDQLDQRESAIRNRLAVIESELTATPDPVRIKTLSKFGLKVFGSMLRQMRPDKILAKPFDWKRRLVEHAFDGKDSAGQPLGVYVSYADGQWSYEMRTILGKILTPDILLDIEDALENTGGDCRVLKSASYLSSTALPGCRSP